MTAARCSECGVDATPESDRRGAPHSIRHADGCSENPAILKTAEVARLCRVNSMTVRRWVAEGHLEAVRLPTGGYRFHRSAVDELLARRSARTDA